MGGIGERRMDMFKIHGIKESWEARDFLLYVLVSFLLA